MKIGICYLLGEPTCHLQRHVQMPERLEANGKGTAKHLILCGETVRFLGVSYELRACKFLKIQNWKKEGPYNEQ